MKTYNTQAKKLQSILSIGVIKDITNDAAYSAEWGKPEKEFRYTFIVNNPNDFHFVDLTMDVDSAKDFINLVFTMI